MPIGGLTSAWIAHHTPTNAPVRLFCFPYAGAGASVFLPWKEALLPAVEVCPVQFPGRESRYGEAPMRRLEPLASAAAEALIPWLNRPFAFFGHSVGALVAFAVAQRIADLDCREPAHLFASGRAAPHCPERRAPAYDLPEPEFVARLAGFNGMSSELLANPELLELALPVIRADFEVYETYQHTPGPRLHCALTAMGGDRDPEVFAADLEAWRDHTEGPFQALTFPGDHFFIHTASGQVLQTIRACLQARSMRK